MERLLHSIVCFSSHCYENLYNFFKLFKSKISFIFKNILVMTCFFMLKKINLK